jgi:hypothetical protein
LLFPCQYNSTNAPYLSSSTCGSYQKYKLTKSGNFQKALYFWKLGKMDRRFVTFLYFQVLVTCYSKGFVFKICGIYWINASIWSYNKYIRELFSICVTKMTKLEINTFHHNGNLITGQGTGEQKPLFQLDIDTMLTSTATWKQKQINTPPTHSNQFQLFHVSNRQKYGM